MDLTEALTTLSETEYMTWAYNNLVMDAEALNYNKLINCYLRKKGIDSKYRSYYEALSFSDLEELIKSEFLISGDLDWKKLQKARRIDDVPLEKEEQQAFCKWLKSQNIGHWANGLGVKLDFDIKYLQSLRSQGHYKGIADMTVLLPKGKAIFIELKRRKGGVVTPEQKKWIEYLQELGYPARVCRGADEAIEFVKEELEKSSTEKKRVRKNILE